MLGFFFCVVALVWSSGEGCGVGWESFFVGS